MAQKRSKGRETLAWDEFARRHAGQPFLQCESLYSLNEPIIDAIQKEVPGFFSPEQERFERDLACTVRFGFFCGRAIGLTKRDDSLDARHARSAKAINDMLQEEYRRTGASDKDIHAYLEAGSERRDVIDVRKESYTGWLVTNREFRDEVHQLRTAWESQIRKLGGFPRFPHWPLNDLGLPGKVPQRFADGFLDFYCRWNLQRMLTWEWPIPMEPDLVGGVLTEQKLVAEAGIRVFLPWYLLRGEKLNLQELVRRSRLVDSPRHLSQWVRKQDDLGDRRYERIAWLYRFLELSLRLRYPEACHRKAQKLDHAFSRVLDRDQESVRKLRQELQRSRRW